MISTVHYNQPAPVVFSSGITLPGLDYRALPRVSNSDLTRIKEEQLAYRPSANRWNTEPTSPTNRGTRTAGKAFHQHLLEPETVGTVLEQLLPDLTNNRLASTESNPGFAPDPSRPDLMDAVWRDPFCRRYLRMAGQNRLAAGRNTAKAERERVVLFTDPTTQLACKTRIDLLYTSLKGHNALIFDFKTTSARTQAQFLQSCYDYDYDRQAAFYLDALRFADGNEWATTKQARFLFIGVMKQQPHRLFAVEATSLPGFVEYGRKKYRFWLRKWLETNGLTD